MQHRKLVELDVYTRLPMQTPTMEHVIPNFLGGDLEAPIIDKTTNDRFGSTIDKALHGALAPIILMLDARPRRAPSKQARYLKNLSGSDGRSYRLLPGGAHAPEPELRLIDLPDGVRIEGAGQFELEEVVEAVVKRAQRRGFDQAKIREKAVAAIRLTPFESNDSKVTIPVDLWTQDVQRASAKIACNLIASQEPELFGHPAFDAIRAFVRGDETPDRPPVEAAAPASWAPHDFDHIIVVRTRTTTGGVDAMVSYFGGLSFLIRLAQEPIGRSLALSYRVDQLKRSNRLNHADDLARPLPDFEEAARRPFEEFMDAIRAQLETVTRRASARSEHQREIKKIVSEEFARGLTGRRMLDPEIPEEEMAIRRIYGRISIRIAEYVVASGRVRNPTHRERPRNDLDD